MEPGGAVYPFLQTVTEWTAAIDLGTLLRESSGVKHQVLHITFIYAIRDSRSGKLLWIFDDCAFDVITGTAKTNYSDSAWIDQSIRCQLSDGGFVTEDVPRCFIHRDSMIKPVPDLKHDDTNR